MGGGRKRKVTAKAANPVTVTSKVTLARQTEAWLSTFDWPTLSNRSLPPKSRHSYAYTCTRYPSDIYPPQTPFTCTIPPRYAS